MPILLLIVCTLYAAKFFSSQELRSAEIAVDKIVALRDAERRDRTRKAEKASRSRRWRGPEDFESQLPPPDEDTLPPDFDL